MPEIDIAIGGRNFVVTCQAGEERFLRSAAAAMDREAQSLQGQLGRLPELQLLLMSGLMVADRTAALEDEVRSLKARLEALQSQPAPAPQTVEVPVVPQSVKDLLAEIAARTESLAERIGDAGL